MSNKFALSTVLAVAWLSLLTGCSFTDHYLAKHPDLDPKSREAIQQHRVILGMFPDEAIAAAGGGPYTYAVKPDKTRWPEGVDTKQVIWSERKHPDDSYIHLVFWTRTQFNTPQPVGFEVVFSHGRAVDITRTTPSKDSARLSQSEATDIAEQAAVKQGYRLGDYRKVKAYYEMLGKDKTWSAFFELKAPIPGSNFMVWINDQTGEARVEPRE